MSWEHTWDDPDNPVVGMVDSGRFAGLNIRKRDQEMADFLGMAPEQCAIARQPIGYGREAMDWADVELTDPEWDL